jgi:hypothetical protein
MGAQRACGSRVQPDQATAHAGFGDVERQNEIAIRRRLEIHFVRHWPINMAIGQGLSS